ncbi:MAG: hypothetical protein RRZ66_07090 [Bacteroidales bacterium]
MKTVRKGLDLMKKLFLFFMLLSFSLYKNDKINAAEILVQDKDFNSGVAYTVIADDNTLTLAFDFSGPIRLMQMAHNGYWVYLNPKGKKKKETGVHIDGLRPPRAERDKPVENKPPEMPEKMQFETAQWVSGNDTAQIRLNGTAGLKAYLDRTDDKNRCVVVIPIEMIELQGKELTDLMIGLVSTPEATGAIRLKAQRERMADDSPAPNFREGNRPERGMQGPPPGGGMRGGGKGGPGMGAPGRGGDSFQGGSKSASSNKIEVWFKSK